MSVINKSVRTEEVDSSFCNSDSDSSVGKSSPFLLICLEIKNFLLAKFVCISTQIGGVWSLFATSGAMIWLDIA